MVTRADIVTEAISWDGTPYHHGAHLKGVGCDCIGLLIGVAKAVGILPATWQAPVYSPQWHLHQNQELLLETLASVGAPCLPLDVRQPGDITLYKFGRVCSHAAILLPDNRIIHALRAPGRVVITGFAGEWPQRLQTVYAFPGAAMSSGRSSTSLWLHHASMWRARP